MRVVPHHRRCGVRCALRPPCVKGKRSAVAGVNDSPVDCQSRDRTARRQLSPHSGDWGIVTTSTTPPSRLCAVTPPLTQGRLSAAAGLGIAKAFGTTSRVVFFNQTGSPPYERNIRRIPFLRTIHLSAANGLKNRLTPASPQGIAALTERSDRKRWKEKRF